MIAILIFSALFLMLTPCAGLCWSYRDWTPGGECKTFDGITFDSTIHCGNGHDFQKIGTHHYGFRARVGNALYAWLYYFRIESAGDGRKITLVGEVDGPGGNISVRDRSMVYQ